MTEDLIARFAQSPPFGNSALQPIGDLISSDREALQMRADERGKTMLSVANKQPAAKKFGGGF
jgi:hypothetical protein